MQTNVRKTEAGFMHKFIGHVIEIIYLDRLGKVSQRRIFIRGVKGNTLRSLCMETNAPRSFRIDNILAYQLIRTVAYGKEA